MIIFITGASSGIGAATARAFAQPGVRLVLAARRMARLRALAETLPVETHLMQLDVRDRAAVDAAVQTLPPHFAAVEVLVNNAGLSRGLAGLHAGDPNDWEEMIDTNVKGLLYVSRAVLPGMVERGYGHVINIGSVAGHETYPGGNVYCATKAAVLTLTKGLRLDLHGTGIRVSSVDPGLVPTEFSTVRFHGDHEKAAGVYNDTRPLAAADVAAAIVWCAAQPPRVNVEDVLLMPTDQAAATVIHRRPLRQDEQTPTGSVAERWLAAWNKHDVEGLLALYVADPCHTGTRLTAHTAHPLKGRDALRSHFAAYLAHQPDLEFVPVSLSSGLRTVVIEYRACGLPETRNAVEVLELDRDGRITHSRAYHGTTA